MNNPKLKIPYPIIVEGKYDKQRVLEVCEATVIATDGFGIFKQSEKLALLRRLGEKTPLIILTDSDGAGKLIRSHISSAVPTSRLIQLYTPQIAGKEKRKSTPSAEGMLGVEGMERDVIYSLLAPLADGSAEAKIASNPLSKTDFYIDGLSGNADSSRKRDKLASSLGLPCGMSANALLAALKILITYEEYLKFVGR